MGRAPILLTCTLLLLTALAPVLTVSAVDSGRSTDRLTQTGSGKLTSTNQGEQISAIDSDIQNGISAYLVRTDEGNYIIAARDGVSYQLDPDLDFDEELGQFIQIVDDGNGILFGVDAGEDRDLRLLNVTDVWTYGVGFEFVTWTWSLDDSGNGAQCHSEMEVIAAHELGYGDFDLIFQDRVMENGPICVLNLEVTDNQPDSYYGLSIFEYPTPITGAFTSDGLAVIIMEVDNQIRTQVIEPTDGEIYEELNLDAENMHGLSLTEGYLFASAVYSGQTSFVSFAEGADIESPQTDVQGSFDMIAAIDSTTIIALDEFTNQIRMVKKIGVHWQLTGTGVTYTDTDAPVTMAKLHNGTIAVGFQYLGVIWLEYDADGDGINAALDQCPETSSGAQIDENGCSGSQLDADGDGVSNTADPFPNDPTQSADADNDGFGDNSSGGEPADHCPGTPANETSEVDEHGCGYSQQDIDQDGVTNGQDLCPSSPPASAVDSEGCTSNQRDPDGDGVELAADLCPGTAPGIAVDGIGCSSSQRDTDEDGLNDAEDNCPFGAARWTRTADTDHDDDGCRDSDEDSDDDGDGLDDALDTCPKGASSGSDIDADGCIDDGEDFDDDGDGIADTQDGCPTLSGTSNKDRHGCPDSDGDGYSDPDDNWGVEQGADYDSLDAKVHADKGPLGVNLDLLALILTALAAIGGMVFAARAKSSKKRRMSSMMEDMSMIHDSIELTEYFESKVELAAVEDKITQPMMDVLRKQYRRRIVALEDGVITPAEQAVLSSEMEEVRQALADGTISKEELANLLADDTELDWR